MPQEGRGEVAVLRLPRGECTPGYHSAKHVFPVAIEHACPNLQQQVRAPLAPAHLLFLHHALADHVIDRRFHKPGTDPLAVAVAFPVIGDEHPLRSINV